MYVGGKRRWVPQIYKVMNMKFRGLFAKNFPHFSFKFRYFHAVSGFS